MSIVRRSVRHNPRKVAIPEAQIRWVVGNFHVGDSDEKIAADMMRRTAKWPAPAQKAAVAYALKCHHKNQKLYGDVMGGRIRSNPSSKRYPAASRKDRSFYAEYDKEYGGWCVFGDHSGHAYASYSSKADAEMMASKMSRSGGRSIVRSNPSRARKAPNGVMRSFRACVRRAKGGSKNPWAMCRRKVQKARGRKYRNLRNNPRGARYEVWIVRGKKRVPVFGSDSLSAANARAYHLGQHDERAYVQDAATGRIVGP